MTPHVVAPKLNISVKPLTRDAFAPFGTVIENPANAPKSLGEPTAVKANQGTAIKYINVSQLTNHYNLAPSGKPARAVMNMFVCSPRRLKSAESPSSDWSHKPAFPVEILERHPFTPQTFIPMGLDPRDETTAYLVIVAPTLPTTSTTPKTSNSPAPYPQETPKLRTSVAGAFSSARTTNTNDPSPTTTAPPPGCQHPKGKGEPDLSRAQAFIASGSQAVTYGPGTWHAPMVALGARPIDFVVVQYANDVSLEDCQEIEIKAAPGQDGMNVIIESEIFGWQRQEKARL